MTRAFVCGCSGTSLSDEECAFVREVEPWGLILFKRNIASPDEVRTLVDAFRDAVRRPDAPVLVDQEGGRVQRLGPPHWQAYPAGSAYAGLAETDPVAAAETAEGGARLIAHDLAVLGISVDCAPVLDVPVPGGTTAIGNRAFGRDARTVALLGRAFAEGLLRGGVLPVLKHAPGHGRGTVDSHLTLPVVTASRAELESDFAPFRALADLPMAMTAHVTYTAIDGDNPATISRKVIEDIIRGAIGFEGLLLSDDLSMQALRGTLGERAEAALGAGCDIALHCNGNLAEARQVADVAPALEGMRLTRAEAALARRQAPDAFDEQAAREALAAAFAGAGA